MHVVFAALGQQVLQNVVTVRVVRKAVCRRMELFQGSSELRLRAVLQQPLNHTAAIRVHGNRSDAARERGQNANPMVRRGNLDAYLSGLK